MVVLEPVFRALFKFRGSIPLKSNPRVLNGVLWVQCGLLLFNFVHWAFLVLNGVLWFQCGS